MTRLTDKLIREAVEEFDGEFEGQILMCGRDDNGFQTHPRIKSFLETKIRKAVEEVKERLTLENKKIDWNYMDEANEHNGYNQAIADLEELKKSI